MTGPTKEQGAATGGIGARLQAARVRAGLSVPQAAERLHLDPGVVLALENEHFSELGADVYVRGHMRHYAMLVKESVPELLALYGSSAAPGAPPDLTLMPHAKPGSSLRAALLLTGVAVVIGVGLIGSVRWIYLDLHPPATAASTTSAPQVLPAPPVAPAPADTPVPAVAPGAASQPAPLAPVGAQGSAPAAPAAPVVKAPRPPRAVAVASLTLKFRSACWVMVHDARGTQLYNAIGSEGGDVTLHGAAPLKVVIGNVPEVEVAIDGEARVIPQEVQTGGRRAEFLVTQAGELRPARNDTTAVNTKQ